MNKDAKLSIRIATADLNTVKAKARQAGLSQSAYVTRCCLGRQIVVIPHMAEVLRQQRGIGNNLNQLATLANIGRVNVISLAPTLAELQEISGLLKSILERGR